MKSIREEHICKGCSRAGYTHPLAGASCMKPLNQAGEPDELVGTGQSHRELRLRQRLSADVGDDHKRSCGQQRGGELYLRCRGQPPDTHFNHPVAARRDELLLRRQRPPWHRHLRQRRQHDFVGGIANTYDFENRMLTHGAVSIVYDGDGNRVRKP